MTETLRSSMHLAHPSPSGLRPVWDLTSDDEDATIDTDNLLKNFQSSTARTVTYVPPTESRLSSTRSLFGTDSIPHTPVPSTSTFKPPISRDSPSRQKTHNGQSHKSRPPLTQTTISNFSTPQPSVKSSHYLTTPTINTPKLQESHTSPSKKRSLLSFFEDAIEDDVDFFETPVKKLAKRPKHTPRPSAHSRRSVTFLLPLHQLYATIPPFPYTASGSLHASPFDEYQDAKIIELREVRLLVWSDIATAVGRSCNSIEQRYHISLKLGSTKSHRNAAVKLLHTHGFTQVPLESDTGAITFSRAGGRRSTARSVIFQGGMVPTPDFAAEEEQSQGLFEEVEYEPVSQFMRICLTEEAQALGEQPGQIPYLSLHERKTLDSGFLNATWHSIPSTNAHLHIGFSATEISSVVKNVRQFLGERITSPSLSLTNYRAQLTEAGIRAVSLLCGDDIDLQGRSRQSVESFLYDSLILPVSKDVETIKLVGTAGKEESFDELTLSDHLRNREMGLNLHGSFRPSQGFENAVYDTLGPTKSFMGTSGAVMSIACAPGESIFAVGSVAPIDPDSLQYNCPLNFLIGDSDRGVLVEKGEHHIARPRPKTGPNSTIEMHSSQDPKVYTTVSNVSFSNDGDWLYSAGYDSTLRVWSRQEHPGFVDLKWTFDMKSPIEILDVHATTGVVAVASRRIDKSIRLLHCSENQYEFRGSFFSSRAVEKPDAEIYPSALQWGVHPWDQHLLVGGFTSHIDIESVDLQGHLCVWDVNVGVPIRMSSSSHSVFDCTWSPFGDQLAIGAAAGSSSNRWAKSIVKVFEMSGTDRMRSAFELECQAYDMNMTKYCQYDENILSAGCTDGRVYVWDIRKPDQYLHVLKHEEPITPLDINVAREYSDTGIGFMAWGKNRSRLYTGASDGIVKSWDIYRAPEDAFVQDVAHFSSALMTASFNDDYSRLVVGEDAGGLSVLEIGNQGRSYKHSSKFNLLRAPQQAMRVATDDKVVSSNEGNIPTVTSETSTPRPQSPSSHMTDVTPPPSHNPVQLKTVSKPSAFFTPDDIADSGRSADRLPTALLHPNHRHRSHQHPASRAAGSKIGRIARPPCNRCGRYPARVYISDSASSSRQDCSISQPALTSASPSDYIPSRSLCERCDFDCFVCGNPSEVDIKTRMIRCQSCNNSWKIGCLGYHRVDGLEIRPLQQPQPARLGLSSLGNLQGDDDHFRKSGLIHPPTRIQEVVHEEIEPDDDDVTAATTETSSSEYVSDDDDDDDVLGPAVISPIKHKRVLTKVSWRELSNKDATMQDVPSNQRFVHAHTIDDDGDDDGANGDPGLEDVDGSSIVQHAHSLWGTT